MPKKTKVYVISQTHWDREWYMTFEQYRFQLVQMIDQLLDLLKKEPQFKHFILDGQTSVLEDYLEIRPEKKSELCRRIREGRIVVGPWYVLPDEFIVSGESIIRNHLLGSRIGKEFGPVSKTGYIPDPFGHLAQLPQILKGLGIDSVFFMRGMIPAEKIGTEFRWQAPDGKSEIYATWIKNGYANAGLLGYTINWGDISGSKFDLEKAIDQIGKEIESLTPDNRCGALLLYNGADHLDPQPELPQVLRAARRRFPKHEFRHSTHEEYLKEVRPAHRRLKVVQSELRSGRYCGILFGVLSARMYLKQLNRRCEALMERWAEPTSALVRHLGGTDQTPFLNQAWKYLLQNHPHDSICGCSIDEVHRENVSRFEKAEQLGEAIVGSNLKWLAAKVNTEHPKASSALLVWNPLPGSRRGSLQAKLTLPGECPEGFRIINSKGEEIKFQVSSVNHTTDHIFLVGHKDVQKMQITLDAPTAGLGYETFWILPEKKASKGDLSWARKATKEKIETDHYRIRFHSNGSFDLFDKQNGQRLSRQLIYEDTEDVGDEYDYSPARRSQTLTTEKTKAQIKIIERGPIFVTYEILHSLNLPVGFDWEKNLRSRKTVPYSIRTLMRVYQTQRRVELATEFDNQAKDHRFRVHFGGPEKATKSKSDGHFGIIPHPVDIRYTSKWVQQEPSTFHQRFFTSLSDGQSGLAVLNRQLTEYEIVKSRGKRKSIALTLLRCVKYLSHPEMISRPGAAGPVIETPEAQCPGQQCFEFALLPFQGNDPARDVTPEAESFATPVRMIAEPVHPGQLPSAKQFVRIDSENVVFSAWKPAENGSGSILRFYNPSGPVRNLKIELAQPMKLSGSCDLKEDETKKYKVPVGKKKIRLGGYEIVSVKVE